MLKHLFLHLAVLILFLSTSQGGERIALHYAPAPPDNPLKGLVPYQGNHGSTFPHSMEFNYLPVSAVVIGPGAYNWLPLENMLNDIASRGHQTVVRFFLEYPGKNEGIPAFLIQGGLKVHTYFDPSSKMECRTPDYSDSNLRTMLKEFIAAWGKKYDGDPRIGFITAGLLGAWGEWHNYPRDDLYASKQVEVEIMDAYEAAFKTTPVLLRYPADSGSLVHAPNASRTFGYHDDSFSWATLDTGKKGDEWFFSTLLKNAGEKAQNKWRSNPIGGEIRPEAWGEVFDEKPSKVEIQDFRKCVTATHASWLLDSGMFERKQSAERIRRAVSEVHRMGYEFHILGVSIALSGNKVLLKVELENRGVAPFYYDWPAEVCLIGADGSTHANSRLQSTLVGICPGDPAHVWNEEIEMKRVMSGKYNLALRVPNVLKNGTPVRFANMTQDSHIKGWVTLGEIELK